MPYMAPALSKEFLDIQANYRVWIHSETRTWHDNSIQSVEDTFEKQRKAIEDTAEKQIKALETLNIDQPLKSFSDFFSKDFLTTKFRNKVEKVIMVEYKINRHYSFYEIDNKKKSKAYDCRKFKTIKPFEKEIYNDELALLYVFKDQVK